MNPKNDQDANMLRTSSIDDLYDDIVAIAKQPTGRFQAYFSWDWARKACAPVAEDPATRPLLVGAARKLLWSADWSLLGQSIAIEYALTDLADDLDAWADRRLKFGARSAEITRNYAQRLRDGRAGDYEQAVDELPPLSDPSVGG
jgi:hypothetical protein